MMRAVIWEAPGQLTITEAADPAPPFALDRFAEALASVRRGEGIKLQVAPAA
jgi:hypothetical protein